MQVRVYGMYTIDCCTGGACADKYGGTVQVRVNGMYTVDCCTGRLMPANMEALCR